LLKVLQKPKIAENNRRRYIPEWLAVLLAYCLLTAILTWPLIIKLGTHLNGDANNMTGDAYQNLWYMWWYGRALELGQDPSQTHLMFGLLPSVQILLSSVVNGLLMWPLRGLFGPIFAYNFAVFSSFPLAGLFIFQLTGEFTKHRAARFVAGFLFAFCSYHLFRAEGHLGLLTIQWLPFYAWRLFGLRRTPNLTNALWVALGFMLASLSDLYYLSYFVLPFTILFFVWFGWFERKNGFWNRRNLGFYGVGLGLGVVALLPFYNVFFRLEGDVNASVTTLARETRELSADLLAFFVPNSQNPLFGGLTAPLYSQFKGIFPIEQAVYPGYVLLIAGLVAPFLKWWSRRETLFWLFLAFAAFVMALGPRLHIAGKEFDFPLPYTLYTNLPFLKTYRAPDRFGIVVTLALAVLAALTLSWLFQKITSTRGLTSILKVGGVAGSLMLLGVLESFVQPWPLPMSEAHIPEIYHQIAAEAGDFLVMELPLGPYSLPLYYQTIHQKPLVGGYPSRISNRMTLSFDQSPYLGMFNPAESSAIMDGSAAQLPNPDIFTLEVGFKQTLQDDNIRYVILRNFQSGRRFFAWMRPYLEKQLGPASYKENDTPGADTLLVWKVEPGSKVAAVAPGQVRIRLGDGWNAGLGKGEDGKLQRLVQQNAGLRLEVAQDTTVRLSLSFTPIIRPQTLNVLINGRGSSSLVVEGKKEWVSTPASFELQLKKGQNLVELNSAQGCLIAGDYIPNSPDRRCISFAIQDIKVEIIPAAP